MTRDKIEKTEAKIKEICKAERIFRQQAEELTKTLESDVIMQKVASLIKQEVEKLFEVYCRQDFNIANAEMGSDDRDDLYYNLLREVASMVNYSRLYNCNYHEPEQLYDLAPKLCWYLKDYEDYGMKRFPEIVEKVIDGIKESFENPIKDNSYIENTALLIKSFLTLANNK